MSTQKEKQAAITAAIREQTLARISFDAEAKTLVAGEGEDIFTANIPDGLTPDLLRAAHDYETAFAAGTAGAFVHHATAVFKEHPDVQQLNFEAAMANKNKLQLMAGRESGLSVALVSTVVKASAGAMKTVFADFNSAMDDLAK